jgi:hypothetical protein
MTYEQFIQTHGPELGQCLYDIGLLSGDGTVVFDVEPYDAFDAWAARPYADASYAW